MVHLQEADLLFTPAEVFAYHSPLNSMLFWDENSNQTPCLHSSANLCSKMFGCVPAQLEFSAEDEEVDIVPSFQVQDPVHDDVLTIAAVRLGRCPGAPGASSWFLEQMGASRVWAYTKRATVWKQGTFGPFRPSQVTQVPLWMALMLHKRRKCRINPPEWLAAGQLEGAHTPVCALHMRYQGKGCKWVTLMQMCWRRSATGPRHFRSCHFIIWRLHTCFSPTPRIPLAWTLFR